MQPPDSKWFWARLKVEHKKHEGNRPTSVLRPGD